MKLRSWLRLMRGRAVGTEGNVLPLVAFMLVVLLGFTAFAIDWGQLHEERRHLQNTADAAALAGAKELPFNPARAEAIARDYVLKNGVAEEPDIEIFDTFTADVNPYPGPDTIRVTIQRNVNTFLAGVIGTPQSPVGAQAIGVKGSLGSPNGCILPLAALEGWSEWGGDPFPFNTEVTLKQNPDGSWGTGNFGGADLYGNGKDSESFFNIVGGNCPSGPGPQVGESYPRQAGNWGNKILKQVMERTASEPRPWVPLSPNYGTFDEDQQMWFPVGSNDFTKLSSRFVYVPVFNHADWTNCTGTCNPEQVQLEGLSMFFLTFIGCKDTDTGTYTWAWDKAGQCAPGEEGTITGQFIQTAALGGFSEWNPYGTQVQRLWQ